MVHKYIINIFCNFYFVFFFLCYSILTISIMSLHCGNYVINMQFVVYTVAHIARIPCQSIDSVRGL